MKSRLDWLLVFRESMRQNRIKEHQQRRKATSNKKAFDWVTTQGENVNWIRKARWTKDEKFYTSAGVSAGMDMTLGFLNDIHGLEFARKTAFEVEYNWTENMEDDNFYLQYQ